MVDRPKGNLDSARIHSRRIAQNPSVREARRDNKKPRKALPPQGQATPPSLTLEDTVEQKIEAPRQERLERMRQVVPQPKAPEMPSSLAPAPATSMSSMPRMASFTPEQQKLLKLLTLKAALESQEIGNFVP
jgi:hypothetical protein